MITDHLLSFLACPRDGSSLFTDAGGLVCESGHRYPVIEGIPVLLLPDKPQTHHVAGRSIRDAYFPVATGSPELQTTQPVESFVQQSVVLVCGQLYRSLEGKLERYPRAQLDLPKGDGRVLLDLGCSWGRWSLAAARAGYETIGIDPNLEAIRTARRIAEAEQLQADFVVGDARFLPFKDGIADVTFSYSVLQHFSKPDVRLVLKEVARVLSNGGLSMIQMANAVGIRSGYQQARRKFREPQGFDVRYWSIRELRSVFSELIGPSDISADCFFGLGVQQDDADLFPLRYRMVVRASAAMVRLSRAIAPLSKVADSVYVTSRKQNGGRES